MWIALLVWGCSGGDTPGEGPPGGTTPVTTPSADGPSPLRRLTSSQYRNTMRDLFLGVDLPELSLPIDGEVHGFDNHHEVQVPSALLIEQYQQAALAVTSAAMDQPDGWLPCDPAVDAGACGAQTVTEVGRRIFRRPLTSDEQQVYTALFDEVLTDDGEFSVAIQVTLQALLNSPEFLYFPELGAQPVGGDRVPLSDHELASRMSYFLWDTMPDEQLLSAADAGLLADPVEVEAQAWRMLDDPRAADALASFHRQWLDLDEIARVSPDPATFPEWDPAMADSMRAELDGHILGVLQGPDPTLSALLLDPTTSVDPWLAPIYDVADGTTELPTAERAGLLTRAGWLAATSHPVNPSPVQRGVFVLEHLMCVELQPPPPDINTELQESQGDAVTNRERYAQHSADARCAGCHDAIDPIGFGFENYDAIGRYRTTDNGAPVDATGSFLHGDLLGGEFDGAVQMSQLLADSQLVRDCVALQWYRYAHGRSETEGDLPEVDRVQQAFSDTGGDVRQLMVEVVRGELFRTRRAM